jgi:hypothetical protein
VKRHGRHASTVDDYFYNDTITSQKPPRHQ